MNVIFLAFPTLHLLTRSYTTRGIRIDGGDVEDLTAIASDLGLPDRRWRDARGPATTVGRAEWLRGDLGGLACIVTRPEGLVVHVIARNGEPVAIVRNARRGRDDRRADA